MLRSDLNIINKKESVSKNNFLIFLLSSFNYMNILLNCMYSCYYLIGKLNAINRIIEQLAVQKRMEAERAD